MLLKRLPRHCCAGITLIPESAHPPRLTGAMRACVLKCAAAVCGLILLAQPVQASTITFNDSFADGHVLVTFTDIAFTNSSISSNCTFSLASSSATCSETLPIEIQADGPGTFDPTRTDNLVVINFLEAVGGPVSDTFFFRKTASSDPNNPVHVDIIFQSDVDGATLTPLPDPGPGGQFFTGVETPSVTFGGCPPDNPNCQHSLFITIISDTQVPEPSSLLLLGSALIIGLGAHRWRKQRETVD